MVLCKFTVQNIQDIQILLLCVSEIQTHIHTHTQIFKLYLLCATSTWNIWLYKNKLKNHRVCCMLWAIVNFLAKGNRFSKRIAPSIFSSTVRSPQSLLQRNNMLKPPCFTVDMVFEWWAVLAFWHMYHLASFMQSMLNMTFLEEWLFFLQPSHTSQIGRSLVILLSHEYSDHLEGYQYYQTLSPS